MMCSIIATLVARYKAGLLVENAPWHEISRFHVAEGAKVPACQAATAALPSHFGGIGPFFQCPEISRANAGISLLGSEPNEFIGPDRDGLGALCVVAQSEARDAEDSRFPL